MANFHEIANPEDCAIGGGSAEEVDSKAGCNRKRDDAQLPENGDVESDVRHGHQDRPRYGATWAKFLDGDLVADGRCPVADCLDNASRLRELPAEKVGDLHGRYHMTSLRVTFVVGSENFRGHDALDMVVDYLRDPDAPAVERPRAAMTKSFTFVERFQDRQQRLWAQPAIQMAPLVRRPCYAPR